MSFYHRRLQSSQNQWEQNTAFIEAELQSLLDTKLLELRSYKYKINSKIQWKMNTLKKGYVTNRSIKKINNIYQVFYSIRVFQKHWTTLNNSDSDSDEDHSKDLMHNVAQEDLELYIDSEKDNNATNETGSSKLTKLKSFQSFPTVKKLDAHLKDVILELLSIQACSSTTSLERTNMKISKLLLDEGEIGEHFEKKDIQISNVTLEKYLKHCLTKPMKLLNKQPGIDTLQNILWNQQKMETEDAIKKINEDAAYGPANGPANGAANGAANSASTVLGSDSQHGERKNKLEETQPTSLKIDEVTNVVNMAHRLAAKKYNYERHDIYIRSKRHDIDTLQLRPPPINQWKWPCIKQRSLRVHIDAFVEESNDDDDDEEEGDTDKEQNTSTTERSWSTEISVDNPIISILHFFRCWCVENSNN